MLRLKTRTVGGVLPVVRQQAERVFQAAPFSTFQPQRPILRQPTGIIFGNAVKSYQIKIFGIAEKNKKFKRGVIMAFNIYNVLKQLFGKKRLFTSEADFQFALAWEIKTMYPNAKVNLEYRYSGRIRLRWRRRPPR